MAGICLSSARVQQAGGPERVLGERRTRDAEGVEFEMPEASRDWGVKGLEGVVSSPTGVRGTTPAKKQSYCFLISVSERISLQHLLKINVVPSQALVEKKWLCSMGRF